MEALAADIQKRLSSRGETSSFEYHHKAATLTELAFSLGREQYAGWGLCIELAQDEPAAGTVNRVGSSAPPLLLALAYGPAGYTALQTLHFSALDSIIPTEADRLTPGPITEFGYPRGEKLLMPLAGLGNLSAAVYEFDAEAAQSVVDREFEVLRRSVTNVRSKSQWQEAQTRFYRAIYRDSFSRIAEAAFTLERYWMVSAAAQTAPDTLRDHTLATKALDWIQAFTYERDLEGSDFVNLVSAAFEGRGDCDSRSLLWAILLEQANIPAAIMVSSEYGHAMGLADMAGSGARFDMAGKKWLVAETTRDVDLGLIRQDVADPAKYLGIMFE
ncbi:hypothetical protein FACS1894142_3540 [Spirochaetia bacterium]|nr:hypothetical protein FACS1894142_3540 [Spirochaetia bacterium]